MMHRVLKFALAVLLLSAISFGSIASRAAEPQVVPPSVVPMMRGDTTTDPATVLKNLCQGACLRQQIRFTAYQLLYIEEMKPQANGTFKPGKKYQQPAVGFLANGPAAWAKADGMFVDIDNAVKNATLFEPQLCCFAPPCKCTLNAAPPWNVGNWAPLTSANYPETIGGKAMTVRAVGRYKMDHRMLNGTCAP